jgi:hypothetical protein
MADFNFEQLTNKEIAELYKNSRKEYVDQRDKNQATQAENAHVVGDELYWQDERGNMIEGTRPQPRTSNGFDEDRLVSEWQDRNKTPAQKLADFANENLHDPQVRALLPEDYAVFEEQSADHPDYCLLGTMLGRGKWSVTALNERDASRTFKFVLGGKLVTGKDHTAETTQLDREEAIGIAYQELEKRLGPKFRDLSPTDINMIQRLSLNNRELALELYLKARLPQEWEHELNRLSARAETTGDNLRLLKFMSNPAIAPALEEAIYSVWFWNKPHIEESPELREFFQNRTADTVLTFSFMDHLHKQFQTGRLVNNLGPLSPKPEAADLNDLSDEQVTDLFHRTRTEFVRSGR